MVRLRKMGAWGALSALLCAAPTAAGFCRTSSCELGEDERMQRCERDVHDCVTEGKPLHWGSPCIPYAVQSDGSAKAGIDGAMLQQAAADAFAAWAGVTCPGGGSPRFQAQFQGFVSCNRREAVCGGAAKNVNVLMFHDTGWPAESKVIGLTTPSGGTSSGLVVDADLELNSQDFEFSGPPGPGVAQLADVLAHELGHFLGLGHSDSDAALMSEDYHEVTLSRELLTADDIAAICAVFPPGEPLVCPDPAPPAYDECQVEPGQPQPACTLVSMTHHDDEGGCSTSGSRPSPWRAVPLLLGALVLLRRRAGR